MLRTLCHRTHFILKVQKDQLIQNSFTGYSVIGISNLETFTFIESFPEIVTCPFTGASE